MVDHEDNDSDKREPTPRAKKASPYAKAPYEVHRLKRGKLPLDSIGHAARRK